MGLLLLFAAGLFALLFVLNAAVRTIIRSERIGFLDTLLAFLMTLVLLAALLANAADKSPLVEQGARIVAIVALLLCALIAVAELRRPQRLRQSRGVLGIGAALLALISTFTVPFVAAYFALSTQPGFATPTRMATPNALTATPSEQARTAASPTLLPTHTPTVTTTPSPTMTSTRPPTATAALPNCRLVMNYNVNVRAAPDLAAELLTTIPFNTAVTAVGRSEDSSWWLVSYEGLTGWVMAEYVTAGETCANLPVQARAG